MLPLENLSHDPEQQYFADGLTDALITDLAKMGTTRITSRTSVIQYRGTKKSIKDIGRELNVDAVVEGTVTYGGDRVRVTAQFIQVSTDMHLWADAYEREVSSILDLQRSLATDIARRIDDFVKPLDRARVVKPEAYGLYLKGRYAFHKYTSQGWQEAIEHFNRAIESDPEFAARVFGSLGDVSGRGRLRRGPDRGGDDARKGGGSESPAIGRDAGERPLRPGHGAHLVRLGLGRRRSRVSTRTGAESQ